jgi:uncharacterized membrane protein YphA (DoxX/SURF4 family)
VVLPACFAASLAISSPLWLGGRGYPPVPLIDGLPQPPAAASVALFAAMLAALAGAAVAPRPRAWLVAALGICGAWAVLDQTRWQPWFAYYVVGLFALLLHAGSGARARAKEASGWAFAPVQLFTVCMYVWSGIHKLNHRYLATDFLVTARPLLGWLGVRAADVPAAASHGAALLSAALELGCGLLLLSPRWRRTAVVALTVMHAFILAMIGPLGAGWNPVVWPWNAAAVAALWLLFWPDAAHARFAESARSLGRRSRRLGGGRGSGDASPAVRYACIAVVGVFGVLPILSFAGTWFASLSFQLYAGKERIALLYYDPGRVQALPPGARAVVRTPGQVNVAAWSLHELNATPVMEERVLLRLARSLARQAPEAGVSLLVASPPALLTGERTTRYFVFRGPDQQPVDMTGQVTVQLHEDAAAR